MPNPYKYFKSAICLAFLATSSATLANAQTIGTAVSVDDTITGNKSRVIRSAAKISANERIRANASGLGHFQFNDGTKLVVGPGTNIVLDELVYNPNGSTFKKFVLNSTAGAARVISGNSPSSAYEIKTPVGTLGIRGTSFDFRHYRGRTYIMLIDGRVEFCSLSGNCETIRRKCDYIAINRGGNVTEPTQPRNGIFSRADMRQFFPFMADQSNVREAFRLPVNTCGLNGPAGRAFRNTTDATGGGDNTGNGGNGGDQ